MEITYYEIKNEGYKDINPRPVVMAQIGKYSAGAKFRYGDDPWRRDDDMFYKKIWDADPDDYRRISEAEARALVESAGGRFVPYVYDPEEVSDGQGR